MNSLKRYSLKDEIAYADIDIEAISSERKWNQTFSTSQDKLNYEFTEVKFKQTPENLKVIGL